MLRLNTDQYNNSFYNLKDLDGNPNTIWSTIHISYIILLSQECQVHGDFVLHTRACKDKALS